jgi:WG containing repeat
MNMNPPINWRTIVFGIVLSWSMIAYGQEIRGPRPPRPPSIPVITRGETRPQTAAEYTWFHNLIDDHVYQYRRGQWEDAFLGRRARMVLPCNSLVVMLEAESTYFSVNVNDGERVCEGTGTFAIHEGIFYCDHSGYPVVFDARPRLLVPPPYSFVLSSEPMCRGFYSDSIDGKLYYCLPKGTDRVDLLDCDEIHGWGLLGTDGNWFIEPIFDGAFTFKNGIAEVKYYGQKRKINTQGEFVE